MPELSATARGRRHIGVTDRERLFQAVHVINLAHGRRALNSLNLFDAVDQVFDAYIDRDTPVRIEVTTSTSGPSHISWQLWPDERRQGPRGGVVVNRLLGGSMVRSWLGAGLYTPPRGYRERASSISKPLAKWGLTSAHFKELKIETTW